MHCKSTPVAYASNPLQPGLLRKGQQELAGCDLDEEGKEDANEEAEGSGRKKKTRLN
ncbi:hypothetical protein F2Q70_00039163 [Brassica cretica]|uniref:Uncharacterized protein n=1 Tax=Brassica cretica TaxID=69181 RepID=A0A8S9KC23_BRACR|nr:hypothetical protein F2Q70_00039163 [Brassica cretica]